MVWFIENLLEKECLLNFQSKTNDFKPFYFSQTKAEFPNITGYKNKHIFKLLCIIT